MRLTVKYDNEWLLVITKEWIKEDLHWSDYCKKYAIPKLAEYEDFMEENGFENLEELKEANDNYRSTAYQYEDDNVVVNELLELLDLPSDENLIIDKIKQLKHDLALYKTAFGNVLSDADEKITTIYRNDCCCSVEMENSKFYLDQAEKELKGEK